MILKIKDKIKYCCILAFWQIIVGYKIAVNTRLLIKDKLEGIGWFSYETLKRITRKYPEHQFYFFFDRPFHQDFIFNSNIEPIKFGLPARHPALFYLWFEHSVNAQLNKIKPDIFLSPDGYLYCFSIYKIKTLKTDKKENDFFHFLKYIP